MADKALPQTNESISEPAPEHSPQAEINVEECLAQRSSQTKPSSSHTAKSPDVKTEYIIYPKNGTDEDAISKTEANMKSITQISNLLPYRDVNKELRMWLVNVTDTQLSAIQKDDGVHLTEENIIAMEIQAAMPSPSTAARLPDIVPDKIKRDLEFTTQTKPASELVVVSQPSTVPNLDDLENYVYENKGGKGRFIYHVELGIGASKQNEFPPSQVEFLQSIYSRNAGQRPDTDDGPSGDSHSTCTASKAVGQKYGSAKMATLVVVKMRDLSLTESGSIFDLILQDIKSKQRQKQSVVTVSLGSTEIADPNNLYMAQQRERDDIANLMANDVIVVVAAGNKAKIPDRNGKPRVDIDTAPGVFEGPDYPLIIIGSSEFTGEASDFSQGGHHLTILGPGREITCQDKSLNAPITGSGTSFSTPLVAGVLANFLAYDEVPFDTSTGHVAANAKKYLQDKASWPRQPNVKVIWNGVTEANNPKKAAGGDSPTTSTTVAPVDPPSAPRCVPNPTAPVKDSHEDELARAAAFFCSIYASKTIPDGPIDVRQTVVSGLVTQGRSSIDVARLYSGTQNEDDVYGFSVESVPNCSTAGGYNLRTPVAGKQCNDIMHNAWKNCNNQGRGGSITAGCLVYKVSTLY